MTLSALLSGAALLAAPDVPVPVIASAQAATVPQAAMSSQAPAPATERAIRLDVTFILNGSPAGEVPVETTTAGVASVGFEQLVARLSPSVSPQLIDDLRTRAGGRDLVPVVDLFSDGFPLQFDVAGLQLKVDIPLDARTVNEISITNRNRFLGQETQAPSDLAFGVSVTFADRVRTNQLFRNIDRDPFNLAAEGFVNVGGKDGVYLTFLGGIQENGSPFRSQTTLFHDDVEAAVRYSLGDINPLTSGAFGNPLNLFGLGVERLYQTIQPYRNLRPSGRGAVSIERPSRVEIFVNGAVYRTITLAPGRYDLRDFPFLDGLNDVRLVVRDDTGRDETIGLSFFSDTELLDGGLSIFSATVGFRRDNFNQFSSPDYDGEPTFSGLYQVGLSDGLTVGGSLQLDRRNALVSGVAVVATTFGLFGFEGAVDRESGEKLQTAFLVSYRLARPRQNGREDRLDIDFQTRSERFSPMEAAALNRNRYRYDLTARYQTSLPWDIYGTVGAGFSKGRGAQDDVRTFNAGASRSFGRLTLGANYSYRNDSSLADHRATLQVSLPLSGRHYVRGSYDTAKNRVGVDYTLQGFEGLNQTTAQVSLVRDDDGYAANGEVEHFSNRFRASVRHDYTRVNGRTQQNTDFAITTGIGYADGLWAIGRDPGRGFVLVKPHATLRDAELIVSNQYTLGPSAKSGLLGPALVSIQRPYQPDVLEVEVPDAPVGYDIGAGRLDILPGAASGYVWRIGSGASNTVVGRLQNAAGEPLAFLVGTLQPIAGAEARTVPFFTNRTGRMVAQKLAPGRYSLIPAGSTTAIAVIDVPEVSEGPIDIGVLTVKDVSP